ncbi:hypothetical protein F2Q70_00005224 [Brassica cretica]|uniref:Uncharacterized protein n=1 Tax=Brassica cretica TaxID=69181 RepID=A0A8S9IMA9_BRACR|nr:hypothetical protein F2Q70_00005224 [Brassica cretica]
MEKVVGLEDVVVDTTMEAVVDMHYKKAAAYREKKSSVCRRNNVIPTTYRRNKSSEITSRKFIFPRKSLGNFRQNPEEMNFRGNSEDHQFVGKVLGIYRGRTSSGYFDALSDGPILGSSDEMFLGIFIGNFRGTEPSENSEEGVSREWLSIYRNHRPVISSHTGDSVLARMLPVACAATHGCTHALMHVSVTCNKKPPRPLVLQHVWCSCIATHGPLHVGSHAQFAGNATPHASVCQAAWNCFMHIYTSFFC